MHVEAGEETCAAVNEGGARKNIDERVTVGRRVMEMRQEEDANREEEESRETI